MNPKLSIIVPVYNTEIYLKECLDSLVNQTFKDIEIIIVNDCSPDNSESIILEYQNKDPRIKYIKHEKNRSVLQARISGILAATGEYIWCVDPDDFIPTLDAFQILVNTINDTQAEVIQFKIDSTIDLHNWFKISVLNLLSNNQEIREFFFTTEMKAFDLANRIVKRNIFNEIIKDIPRDSYMNSAEDFFMASLIMNSANSYIGVDEFLYFYRQNDSSLTNTALTKDLIQAHIKGFQKILDVLSLSLSIKDLSFVQKELGLQTFVRIVKSLDKISPKELNELLSFFTIIDGGNYSKPVFLWCMSDMLIFDENSIENRLVYFNNIKTLLITLKFLAPELIGTPFLFYIYTTEQINDDSILHIAYLFRLQQNYNNLQLSYNDLQQDRWYNFGQLSRKQKIKKIIIVISKKLRIYPILKKLYEILRK